MQGRELQFKGWDLFYATDQAKRQDLFWGTMLAYYSAIYETSRIVELPDNIKKVMDEELREQLRKDNVRAIWDDIRHLHSDAFGLYVDRVRGIRTS